MEKLRESIYRVKNFSRIRHLNALKGSDYHFQSVSTSTGSASGVCTAVKDSGTTQLSINFDAGLLERFPKFEECLRHSVFASKRQQKYIAADLGEAGEQNITSSKLTRMLGEYDPDNPHFPARLIPDLLTSTEDLSPLFWLIEKFLEDPGEKRKRALDDLAELLPQIEAALALVNQSVDEDDAKLKAVT